MRTRLLGPAVLAGLLAAAPGAEAAVRTITPAGPSLAAAYAASADGDVIELAGGDYPAQTLASGSKAVTVRAAAGQTPDLEELTSGVSGATIEGLKLRRLHITGGRSVYQRLDIDGRFAQQLTLEHSGGDSILRDSRVGNVTDEKGAIVGESGFTIDNVTFHDVLVTDSSVHNECIYATGAEGLTVRNSRFYNCATMDLFFTNWAGGPDYGDVTLENNVFEHSTMETPGSWHYYSLYVAETGPGGGALTNWVVRNNTFEIDAMISRTSTSGSRWVGNLGGWSCVDGVVYRRNVGSRCGDTDKAISPDSSTKASRAPFGWADPAAHDFRLTAGSVAIGAGDPSDAPATDADGNARDGQPDAGAYEFGAGPPSKQPPQVGAPAPAGGAALHVRSARLSPRTICRTARRGCHRVAWLKVGVSRSARLSITVSRLRRGGKAPLVARTLSRQVRTSRTVELRARGLRAGSYRVSAVAIGADGARSEPRTFRLRVK
jgi:hypothetical protein